MSAMLARVPSLTPIRTLRKWNNPEARSDWRKDRPDLNGNNGTRQPLPASEEQGEEKAIMATKARGNRDLEEGRAGFSISSRSGGKQSKLLRQVEFPAVGDNYFDSYLPFGHMPWWRRLI